MKLLLATGIYPPAIGGPATYVRHLAEEFSRKGDEVTVVTYCGNSEFGIRNSERWTVVCVSLGLPIVRWWRYAKALREHGKDADIVYAFSSVSCGVPLWLARLKKPKKVLRLGGDFLWERYTDRGGEKSLRSFYAAPPKAYWFLGKLAHWLLSTFDHVVFSTEFQEKLYEQHVARLPRHSVIENACPEAQLEPHSAHEPLHLLFMGRAVRFKNLPILLQAVALLPNTRLTIVGEGPETERLRSLARRLKTDNRVMFVAPVHGEEKYAIFKSHDVLVLPSLTEISPNVALEARAAGLPVLLTEETGLSERLSECMILRDTSSLNALVEAIKEVRASYRDHATACSFPLSQRNWQRVGAEHAKIFSGMLGHQ